MNAIIKTNTTDAMITFRSVDSMITSIDSLINESKTDATEETIKGMWDTYHRIAEYLNGYDYPGYFYNEKELFCDILYSIENHEIFNATEIRLFDQNLEDLWVKVWIYYKKNILNRD